MPRPIDVQQGVLLLKSRTQMLDAGLSRRALTSGVADGSLTLVRRGCYVDTAEWRELYAEGKQLLRVLAVAQTSPRPLFSHISAAVLWGLPLHGQVSELVHTVVPGRQHTRTVAGVARHERRVDDGEVVEQQGLRCTSLARTVFDVARTLRPDAAVAVADAALRMTSSDQEVLRGDILRFARSGLRGVRQARWVADFADGRAQLPGESVSRVQLDRLGFRDVRLQVPVTGAQGDRYFVDFEFARSRAFGEFDGEGKYLDPELRDAPTPAAAVLAEKRREDDIRGVTGCRVVRWGSSHIRTPDVLGARLAAFGIRPPG